MLPAWCLGGTVPQAIRGAIATAPDLGAKQRDRAGKVDTFVASEPKP